MLLKNIKMMTSDLAITTLARALLLSECLLIPKKERKVNNEKNLF